MTEVNKTEQHTLEWTIFLARGEAGLQAMRTWLYARRDQINKEWPGIDDVNALSKLQGEAKAVAKLIKLIDTEPAFKQVL